MEAGLALIDDNYFLVCVTLILDRTGQYFLGISGKTQLPKRVSEEVKNGEQFGIAIRQYAKENNDNDQILQTVLNSLITRKELFVESTNNAFTSYILKIHLDKFLIWPKNHS